jgi:hypothetical protein
VWWARKVFDSQRGRSVQSVPTSPSFGVLCWASWRQRETGEGEVHAEPRSRWCTWLVTDQMRRVKFSERFRPAVQAEPGGCRCGK